MRRLVDEWSLDDPNPEGYRRALESMSSLRSPTEAGDSNAVPTECEPERMVQIAVEVGAIGPQVYAAMSDLFNHGRADLLLNMVEGAPSPGSAAPLWDFLLEEGVVETLLAQKRVDFALVSRFARRIGPASAGSLLGAAIGYDDPKLRIQIYDLVQSLGDGVGKAVAARIPDVGPPLQRELLALLARLGTLPIDFSPADYLINADPLVRREAVKLLLRDPESRESAAMTALADEDDRVVFMGLTAAQEQCPRGATDLMKQRVDLGQLDSQLRTMCIRIVAHQRAPGTLQWLLGYVVTESRWPRRPKLRPSTPEMLAALSSIASGWSDDPAAKQALKLAAASKHSEVRAKLSRARPSDARGASPA
jgi:hypothetical protein